MRVEKFNVGDKVVKVGDKFLVELKGIITINGKDAFFDFGDRFSLRFNENMEDITPAPETIQEAYNAGFVKGLEEAKAELERAMENAVKNISHNGDTYTATAYFHGAHIPTDQGGGET